MNKNGQSLIEFAIILIVVTVIAVVSLQLISNKINSSTADSEQSTDKQTQTTEEEYCKKMGLSWDKENGVCEAK